MSRPVDRKNISFVVPVLNAERHLHRCLEQIQSQMESDDELFVADNGSTDNSVEIAKSFAEARVDIKPKMTVAGLRNVGAAATTGALLAFIDSDCILQAGWREAVRQTFEDENISATGALPEVSENATWVERAWCSLKYGKARPVDYLPAMNFVVRRTAFEAVDGFDDRLETDEDTDICRRLTLKGATIFENPQVAVIHLGNPRTLRTFVTKERWHASGIMVTMARHGIDKPMLLTFVFMAGIILSLALIIAAIFGQVPPLTFLPPFLLVPVATVAYRLWQYRNYSSAPALLVLYTLFFLVRSAVVLAAWTGSGKDQP